MSDITEAIDVTTRIDIDWGELGRVFADQPSPEQAEFFVGFYEAVVDAQLAYIGSDTLFDRANRADVGRVYADLAHFINPTDD